MTPTSPPGRVSIVIPCFNDGAYVGEAVESALAQTQPAVEIIVVDDGSTDATTRTVLEALQSDAVQVHRQGNRGLSAARNAGIALATGDYVLPLDSDDRISPDYVQLATAVLDARPRVGIVGGGIEFFGLTTGRARPTYDGIASMLFENRLYACSVTRRADWEAVGGYPEHVRFAEDWIYWLRILGLGRDVHILDETVWFYRQRPGQMTRDMGWRTATTAIVNAMRDQPDLYAAHMDVVTEYVDLKLSTLDTFRHRFGRLNDFASWAQTSLRRWRR
ncbi:glycosyltransferase family 2 protein [Nocardioides astragali]|uniref:Glycosyltransferase family 2 protein n=1 Tax=Nocardioides astragali TaxID=1776736 RepID=A0ABW2N3N7_9ACTN|nr:glycosyltransferase family A protein [Nocardioides astragali]